MPTCKAPLTRQSPVKYALLDVKNTIRALRSARGLSQGELGVALRVSRQTINAIETERYTPSLPLAMAMARYFASSVEEIFDANGEQRDD
jgi:putative transcriptional regulator